MGSVLNEFFRINVSQPTVRDEVQLLRKFRLGLQSGAIEPHYQPEIDLHRPDWMGFEALSRWHDPEWGDISPGVFIPLAEKQGLLAELTCVQIHKLAQDAPRLTATFGQVALALNLSPRLIGHAEVWSALTQALACTQKLDLSWELEITEAEPIADFGKAGLALQALREQGVKIVLDDFGTGWSSWSRAELLRAQRLKVDSVFVRHHQTEAAQQFLKRVADHARTAPIEITVEGIETEAEESALKAYGFSRFQGWLYAKAMPLQEVLHFRYCP